MKCCIYFLSICLMFSSGCKKAPEKTENVFSGLTLSPRVTAADGSSVVDVSVKLNSEADADKKSIVFTASGGSFVGAEGKTITKAAEFIGGELISSVKWKAGTNAGTVVITAKPAALSPYQDYILTDSVILTESVPDKITISASAFGVPTGFAGEIKVTGLLKNTKGKGVSGGYKVIFEDVLANGTAANGRFRMIQSSSNETSEVSALYGAGSIQPGTSIYLRVTLLDKSGNKTPIADTAQISIINP